MLIKLMIGSIKSSLTPFALFFVFAGSTLETMLLVRQPGIALELASSLSLPGAMKRSSMVDWTQSETPACPKCGSSTVYVKGRYGPYFPCEDTNCDGKVSIFRKR